MTAAPQDIAAERAVVGVCLNTRHGIGRVAQLVEPGDFYSLRLRELFAAAVAMPEVVTLDERVTFATSFCDVTEAEVLELISESPVMFDASPWAKRVAAEARRWRAMQACVDAYEALRDGADVDEVLEVVCV